MKIYNTPEMELVVLACEDVLTLSVAKEDDGLELEF